MTLRLPGYLYCRYVPFTVLDRWYGGRQIYHRYVFICLWSEQGCGTYQEMGSFAALHVDRRCTRNGRPGTAHTLRWTQ